MHKSSNIKDTIKSSLATEFPKRKKIMNRNVTLKACNGTTIACATKIKNATSSKIISNKSKPKHYFQKIPFLSMLNLLNLALEITFPL